MSSAEVTKPNLVFGDNSVNILLLCVVHHVSAFETDLASSLKHNGKMPPERGMRELLTIENGAAGGSATDFKKPGHAAAPASATSHRLLK